MVELTAEQKRNIRIALREAKRKNASPKEQKALVEAMGVESTYRDLNYGDRDSLGILQQRNNGAWGAAKESVATDVGQFLAVARTKNASGKYGSAGSLAQAVQGSGFPDRYQQRSGEADAILARYGGGGSQARVRAPGAQSGTVSTTTPGTDNSALRRQLVGQFLQQGGVRNPNAVLGLAAQYGGAADVPGTTAYTQPSPSTQASPSRKVKAGGIVPLGGSKNAGKGAFEITGPNPGRLKSGLTSFAKKVASVYGGTLEGLDGSTHSKLTTNGNVSEHYTGNATDIFTINGKPAQGRELIRAGRAALIAAGMPRAKALKAPGGLYNVGNHQIIFGVSGDQYGGNHLDHLHISTHAK